MDTTGKKALLAPERLRLFMDVGFYRESIEDKGFLSIIDVVNDLEGLNFSIMFCGLRCMEEWFGSMVRKLSYMDKHARLAGEYHQVWRPRKGNKRFAPRQSQRLARTK